MLPTQWLRILLRYTGRTEDDYKSFVSFINLKRTNNTIDDEKLHIICAGINEITTDIEQQKIVMDSVLENNINDFINKSGHSTSIYENSKSISKRILEIELKEAMEQASASKEIIAKKDLEIDDSRRKYLLELDNIKNKLYEEKFKRYETLTKSKEKIDKNAKIFITSILATGYTLILCFMILLFDLINENWNTVECILFIVVVIVSGNAIFFDNKLSLKTLKHSLINKRKKKSLLKEKVKFNRD